MEDQFRLGAFVVEDELLLALVVDLGYRPLGEESRESNLLAFCRV